VRFAGRISLEGDSAVVASKPVRRRGGVQSAPRVPGQFETGQTPPSCRGRSRTIPVPAQCRLTPVLGKPSSRDCAVIFLAPDGRERDSSSVVVPDRALACAFVRQRASVGNGRRTNGESPPETLGAFSTMASRGRTRKARQTYRQGECGAERHHWWVASSVRVR
jgi:hypothetical protein